MRLSVETGLILAVDVAAYALLSVYAPQYLQPVLFYFVLTIGTAFVIILLSSYAPLQYATPENVVSAFVYSYTNFMVSAVLVSLLYTVFFVQPYSFVRDMVMPALYYLLVASGEDLFTYGLPLALEPYMPEHLRYVPYVAFVVLFGLLHYPSYGNWFMLLQPLIAAAINMYIVYRYGNISGIILGHFLADLTIISMGV